MTIPTGTFLGSQVLTELGLGHPSNLGQLSVRNLAGAPSSGPFNLSSLRGKTAAPGYTPMTVVPGSTDGNANSASAGGTVAGTARVTVSGGNPGYTYNWVVVSNPNSCSFSNGSSSSSVSHTYVRLQDATFTIQLRCDVTDSTGHVVSSSTITVNLNVSST